MSIWMEVDQCMSTYSAVDMNNNTLINLKAVPVNPQDAATKHYTDTYFFKRDGSSTMNGDF